MKTRAHAWLVAAALCTSCTARNYTYYLIEPQPKQHPALREGEESLRQANTLGSTQSMKVRWNDGSMVTEVELPVLAGQRTTIEHGTPNPSTSVKTIPQTRVVPPLPTQADKTLEEAYRQRGLRVDESAPQISIIRGRTMMQDAIKAGNYELALTWCEQVLQRYKSHPEFLRAKASILLMMGERDKAVEIYEQAEAIESDPAVRKKLEELQRQEK